MRLGNGGLGRLPISGNACNSKTGSNGYGGIVAVIATFDDEVKELGALGVDTAFNLYSEAGAGFAHHVSNFFSQQRPRTCQNAAPGNRAFGKILSCASERY